MNRTESLDTIDGLFGLPGRPRTLPYPVNLDDYTTSVVLDIVRELGADALSDAGLAAIARRQREDEAVVIEDRDA